MDPAELRSSWIKWARAIELRQELARGTREYGALHAYEYVREDNSGAFDDPLIRAHWKLALDPLRINSSTATVSQRRIPTELIIIESEDTGSSVSVSIVVPDAIEPLPQLLNTAPGPVFSRTPNDRRDEGVQRSTMLSPTRCQSRAELGSRTEATCDGCAQVII
jgi:hypothetical protein